MIIEKYLKMIMKLIKTKLDESQLELQEETVQKMENVVYMSGNDTKNI